MKLKSISLVLALAGLVSAGLEDAKHSTVLSASNFDSVIASQSVGTLTAFFAPWCGHCKSLEPTWTKIAGAFEGDDRCKVAHFDADNAENRDIASKFGVSGFPTIKFIPTGGKQPAVDYNGPRTEEAFIEFLNKQCGTAKLPGGRLSALAGRVPSLDKIASTFFGPSATRPELYASASALASSLKDDSTVLADAYLKVMTKWLENAEGAQDWLKKESERLGKMLSKKGSLAGKKLDELQMRQNILAAFNYVKDAGEDAAEAAESAAHRIKEEL